MVVGSDIPVGQLVKWFSGGQIRTQTVTLSAGDVSAGYLALTYKADYGSVVLTVNGVSKACTEKTALGAAPASEVLGTNSIAYASMTAADVAVFYYVDITTGPLAQIGAALDLKTSISADTKVAGIHGQGSKLKVVLANNQDAQLEQFEYNQAFLTLVLGDTLTRTPATGMSKLSTKVTGLKKLPVMVGIQFDASFTTVLYIWYLYGAQLTAIDISYPAEDMYKDSMKFLVDNYLEVDLA